MNSEHPDNEFVCEYPDEEYSYEVNGGDDIARSKIVKFLEEKEINGVSVESLEYPFEKQWGSPDGESWYGLTDRQGNSKWAVLKEPVCMHPEEWLKIQREASNSGSYEKFIESAYDETVKAVREKLDDGSISDVPSITMEISRGSSDFSVTTQEGRSRGLGALRAGQDEIPIFVVSRRTRR
jgi:hypothetical protein